VEAERTAIRVGPLTSTPGQWHFLATDALRKLLRPLTDRIVRFTGRAVSGDGKAIGFPPLHMHHLHVQLMWDGGRHASGRQPNIHWFETHGDFSSGDSWGMGAPSTESYSRLIPEGYCMTVQEMTERIPMVWSVTNDVRPKGASVTQPPLVYFIEVAFDLAPQSPPCKPVTIYWWNNPEGVFGIRNGRQDPYRRYDVLPSPSVAWWSGKLPPRSGRLLPGAVWLHTHRARYSGLLLFDRHADAVWRGAGGCREWFVDHREALEDPLRLRSGVALSSVFETLQKVPGVICSHLARAPTAVDINGTLYDRAGPPLQCRPSWHHGRGAPFSMFAFHDARWDAHVPHFPMHFNIFAYVASDPADPSDSSAPAEGSSDDFMISPAREVFSDCPDLATSRLPSSPPPPPPSPPTPHPSWPAPAQSLVKLEAAAVFLGLLVVVCAAVYACCRCWARRKAGARAARVESNRSEMHTASGGAGGCVTTILPKHVSLLARRTEQHHYLGVPSVEVRASTTIAL
jgi:hypothetical protein